MAAKDKDNKRYIINVALNNDNEPREIFVADGQQDYLIRRGEDVVVPESVIDVLNHAVIGVTEVDPKDPLKTVVVDRMRFPFTLKGLAGV